MSIFIKATRRDRVSRIDTNNNSQQVPNSVVYFHLSKYSIRVSASALHSDTASSCTRVKYDLWPCKCISNVWRCVHEPRIWKRLRIGLWRPQIIPMRDHPWDFSILVAAVPGEYPDDEMTISRSQHQDFRMHQIMTGFDHRIIV